MPVWKFLYFTVALLEARALHRALMLFDLTDGHLLDHVGLS